MANKNTRVEARNPQGNELRVSHTELDSPVLDVNAWTSLISSLNKPAPKRKTAANWRKKSFG